MNRESGYYQITVNFDNQELKLIAYWYEGSEDCSGKKSAGHFDVSNHWIDTDIVYENQCSFIGKKIKI